jgi:3',5'-cyclic AMP phosphodiesterase CpdA
VLIAQVTDCHVVEPGGLMADRADPAAGLRAAIASIEALSPPVDLVLATGDLVNDGRPEQYDHLERLLADLGAPVVPVVGNHDDRTELRRRFPGVLPPGGPDEPVDLVVGEDVEVDDAAGRRLAELPVRIVVLDTTIPRANEGRFTSGQASWLDARLAEQPDRPTLVVQHHPPFRSGIEWMDRDCGFTGADLEAEVVARHRQVEAIVCGHLHRAMHRRFGGTVASTCPSTAVQLGLRLDGGPVEYTAEPPGFALHHWSEVGGLVSHLVPIGDHPRWVPSWAD